MDLTGVVAAVRAAVAGALGVSPSARLRADVYKDVALIKALDERQLHDASAHLRGLVVRRCAEIARRGEVALSRERPWATLVVAFGFATPLGLWGWWLWPIHGWRDWVAAVPVAIGLLFFVVGGVGAFFSSKKEGVVGMIEVPNDAQASRAVDVTEHPDPNAT